MMNTYHLIFLLAYFVAPISMDDPPPPCSSEPIQRVLGHLRGDLFPHIPSTVAWEMDRLKTDICAYADPDDQKGCVKGIDFWWPTVVKFLYSEVVGRDVCQNSTTLQNIDTFDCANCKAATVAIANFLESNAGPIASNLSEEEFCYNTSWWILSEEQAATCSKIMGLFMGPAIKSLSLHMREDVDLLCPISFLCSQG